MTELEKLLELLLIEREEDHEQFKRLIESLPLEERVNKGLSWYPVQIVGRGYTIGDRAYVTVERTKGLEQEHQFRGGKIVQLFTRQPSEKKTSQKGVIHFVQKHRMKIILNTQDHPDWVDTGMLGVDLLFDDRTYQEMERALKQVMRAKGDRLAELRDIFLGKRSADFLPVPSREPFPLLNDSQNRAVDLVRAAQQTAVIHGPPGTGKTTTLVEVVRFLTETEHTVLVTAPSNTAVDVMTERLAAGGLRVVRIGNISRVDEDLVKHTLEVQLTTHPEAKTIKKIKKEAAELRRAAIRYKRRFGAEERRERGRMFKEAGELSSWANQLEDRLMDQILNSAQVITCTLVGSASRELERLKFRTVVIDEAAQALEPATWIPILKASRVVLTGDPFQLPPTVKSSKAAKQGFNVTLIEKALQRIHPVALLTTQYRMHQTIMGFSNRQFYESQLKAADQVESWQLPIPDNVPLIFIDTAGAGFEERVRKAYGSRYNPEEFQILCEHLYQLIKSFDDTPEAMPSIALISPYREQVAFMEEFIREEVSLQELSISINTIDGFQGQEKDVVFLSLVRSNSKGEIGFLKDYRRMNVAMTRARKQLIVVGDSATIGADPFFANFLSYCEEKGSYRTAFDYLHK